MVVWHFMTGYITNCKNCHGTVVKVIDSLPACTGSEPAVTHMSRWSHAPEKNPILCMCFSEPLNVCVVCCDVKRHFCIWKLMCIMWHTDSINIKILNAGAWARSSDRVTVTLPMELEDYIPQVEEFYRQKHNGRKLQWHHLMSNGIVRFVIYYRRNGSSYCNPTNYTVSQRTRCLCP